MPVAATIKVAVCPAVTVWLAGCVVMESAVEPVPLREMARGEFTASLVTDMLPDAFPAVWGVNWSRNARFCPAATETEDIPPTTLKPAPEIVACEMVTAAAPELVRVSVWKLLKPVDTLPKEKLVALAASDPVEAVLEFDFVPGVPAPVTPTQPEIERALIRARKMVSDRNVVRRFCASLPWA